MCGVTGILSLTDSVVDQQLIINMNAALQHRGPDDDGIYTHQNIGLGHKRLSILDLSAKGKQPMTSHDGRYVIVHNGEVYNYREIRAQLSGFNFQSDTDTEVILAAWEHWGIDCLQHFNGMFAFAIWDTQKKELLMARDRLGIKPLYFSHTSDQLVFASEIRALLKSGMVDRKLDHGSLVDYLRYSTVHAPNTIIKEVKMLLPGHYIKAGKDGFSISSYWNLIQNTQTPKNGITYKEVCNDVKELMRASIQRRIISDVPFGAFLSGGIDSSAIVALMSEVCDQPVKTFTIVFGEEEFSEEKYARMVADKYQTDHHPIHLQASEFLDQLPEALQALDHPSGDGVNSYIVSKYTKQAGITVALAGTGGDEVFAGYPEIFNRLQRLQKFGWIWNLPGFVRMGLAGLLNSVKPGIQSAKISALLKEKSASMEHAFPYLRQILMDDTIRNTIEQTNGILDQHILKTSLREWQQEEAWNELPYLSKISIGELWFYLQNVLIRDTDQASMAHALEVRVPFLDHELIEYVLGVPDKYKDPVTPKRLLVDAMGDLLPAEIVNRPKMGFTFPWAVWMKNDLKQLCGRHIEALAGRSIFQKQTILSLWNRFLQGDPQVSWTRIWLLVVLEHWLSANNIEG